MEAKRSSKDENDGMSLPEDIIFDVLVRLPVKALCRFRCVSKAWRALISDPTFVAAQRSHAGRLIVAAFGSWPDIKLRLLDMQGNVLRVFEASGCCDHRSTRMDLIFVNRKWQGATIIDPAARRAFTVGRHADARDEGIRWSDYSFGRAAPSGAYKVLRLSKSNTTVCEVGTITDYGAEPTWRRKTPMPAHYLLNGDDMEVGTVTVKGVLYFMPYRIYGRPACWNPTVAAFDLESEVWMDTINAPPLEKPEPDYSWIALTELKETLCMVHNVNNIGGLGFYSDIWRLIDHNNGIWVKAHRIRLPAGCSYTMVLDLDVLDDGKILLMNKICSRFVLQSFDPSTEEFVDIMKMAEKFIRMTFYDGSLPSS